MSVATESTGALNIDLAVARAVELTSLWSIENAPLNNTSRPAIAGKPRCSVYKLWWKYKCEKRASNTALNGNDVDKMMISLFYATIFYLMQNYAAFTR